MMTVQNKKVISEVARSTYKGNRKRNVITMFAICLTTFLITVVIALGVSYWETISTRQIRMEGMDYDIELTEPREDQVETIRAMDSVAEAGIEVKCAIAESYQDIILEKTRMFWMDETGWNKQRVPALEYYKGTYPERENDIMLSDTALAAMGIEHPEIGMPIVLGYNTLNAEDTNQELLKKEFVLSGHFKDYSGKDCAYISKKFWKETGVKQTDFTQGKLRITLQNPLYSEADIMEIQNAIDIQKKQVIIADYDTISSFWKMVIGLTGLLVMIFLSAYLSIYNTLYISISRDIRYYGQLKTIGMTSKQLKKVVYLQALWNSCIGIPIGLLLGVLVVKWMVPQMIHMSNPTLAVKEIVQASPWIYVIAIVFSFATTIISSRKPAQMVAECSPIEAMRYLAKSKTKKKTRKTSASLRSMAIQNMFRDRKQAFIILVSFVIAISIFLIVNVVIQGNDAKSVLNSISTRDIRFQNEVMLEEELQLFTADNIHEVQRVDGVKEIGVVTSAEVVVPYQEAVYGTYFKSLYKSRYSPGNYKDDMLLYQENPEHYSFKTRIIGLNEVEFDKLNDHLSNTLDQEQFEKGEIAVVDNFFMDGADEGMSGKTTQFYIPGVKEQLYSIKIAAVVGVGVNPAYFAGGYTPTLMVSETYAQKVLGQTVVELINVSYDEPFLKDTEEQVKEVFADERRITYESKLDRYTDMKQTEVQVRVIGNSIGFLMGLLAVLNYFNMMAASIQNRTNEFATMESVGMTSKQLRKLLAYEGVGYAVISVALALLVGTPLSYLVFHSSNLYGMEYVFPWVSNLVLIGIIMVICVVLPVRLYRKTQEGSIVERLSGR